MSAGATAAALHGLPADVGALARIVQGLLMHEHIASTCGLALTPAQHAEAQMRSVDRMLACIIAKDDRPLTMARPAGERTVGVCRHFSLLHVAMLRRQGIAARARCGFGTYFTKGKFVDHWVTEYRHEAAQRWVLVDAQLDEHQRGLFPIDFDPLDVPRDRFLVAGEAWRLCRRGAADPGDFGILDMAGLWFVAGNVIRDIAALNDHVMLPWDVWGGMPTPGGDVDIAFFDGLAGPSCTPDDEPEALRAAYADPRVAVPDTVFNAVLGRPEPAI